MSREERLQAKLAITMGEDDRPVDFGTFLRRAREQRGVSLQQLAIDTKISARVLEALERNDPSKLPGGIFSRAFVRAYAREVGLDPAVAVASFVSAFPEEAGAEDMPATTSAVEVESFEHRRRVVKFVLRVLGVAVVVGLLGLLYYYWSIGRTTAETGQLGEQPAASTSALPVAQAAAPVRQAAPDAGQALPAATPPPGTPEPAAASAQQPPEPAGTAAPLIVALSVAEPCWLSISVDGTRMPSRIYDAGERAEFSIQRSITMTAGNAAALSVTLNGRPARALGAAGQVVTATIPASGYESFLR